MQPADVSETWLKRLEFQFHPGATIDGVVFQPLTVHLDGRGDVIELWSETWDQFERPAHVYQSATDPGVVKCWHLHAEHTDQFTVTRGKIQVVAADLRSESPTFGQVNSFIFGHELPAILKIPPGLLHGWKCLVPPEVIVVNLQTHVYDPSDEYKFPWNCVLTDVWQPRNG